MHIIIVGTAFPLRGGIAHYNALLAAELSTTHRVETITFRRQYPAILFPGTSQEEPGTGPHAQAAECLIDSVNPLNWITVGREIRRRKPDLLIFKYWLPFFGPCFGTIARVATRGMHTRVLFICDNVLPHERRVFDRLFTRYAFGAVDCFIAQSDAVERDLKAFWPKAVFRNVPHPIYSMFGPGSAKADARQALGLPHSRVLLFFGYIRPYKGLHVLLDALARVRASLDAHLVVAGEFYDAEQSYRDQLRDLRLEAAVTLCSEYLPNERVPLFFSAADAVILPYLSATQSGIAQIAFYYDLPVIATDVGGLAEVVRDGQTGLIVPPADPQALAAAILRFYNEQQESRLRDGVRREKERYSWAHLREAIEDLCPLH